MESLNLILETEDAENMEEVFLKDFGVSFGAGTLPDGGDFAICPLKKEGGSVQLALTFTIRLPDGQIARAQTQTSLRLFLAAAMGLEARYGDQGITLPGKNSAEPGMN